MVGIVRDARSRWRETNALLRELCGLARELLQVLNSPAQTPAAPRYHEPEVSTRPADRPRRPGEKLTARDVRVVTRQDLARIQQEAEARRQAPWREGGPLAPERIPPAEAFFDAEATSPIRHADDHFLERPLLDRLTPTPPASFLPADPLYSQISSLSELAAPAPRTSPATSASASPAPAEIPSPPPSGSATSPASSPSPSDAPPPSASGS